MKATLIVNHFADGAYFKDIYGLITESASLKDISLSVSTSGELLGDMESAPQPSDFALFWDKDIHLARRLEGGGWRLFNSAHTVEVCDNKAFTAHGCSSLNLL